MVNFNEKLGKKPYAVLKEIFKKYHDTLTFDEVHHINDIFKKCNEANSFVEELKTYTLQCPSDSLVHEYYEACLGVVQDGDASSSYKIISGQYNITKWYLILLASLFFLIFFGSINSGSASFGAFIIFFTFYPLGIVSAVYLVLFTKSSLSSGGDAGSKFFVPSTNYSKLAFGISLLLSGIIFWALITNILYYIF